VTFSKSRQGKNNLFNAAFLSLKNFDGKSSVGSLGFSAVQTKVSRHGLDNLPTENESKLRFFVCLESKMTNLDTNPNGTLE
jgi:hypothetical protein